ncbi:MAG TPA: response regulator [Chloroflexi bacterium]|nr:response regulator [Chloroflexota bacterium]
MPETKILVVDDEPGIAHLCERLLRRAGYEARAVTNPRRALLHLQTHPVDLLLVDIRMPGMDGFELMRQARQTLPDLAVVIMTGFGTVETAIEALRLGAEGLILKPFSRGAELVESVAHALEAHRRSRDAQRLRALRPLFEVTRRLFSETDPEQLRLLLVEAVCEHLQCEHAALYALPRSGNAPPELEAARGEVPPPGGGYVTHLWEAAARGVVAPGKTDSAPLPPEMGYASLVAAAVSGPQVSRLLLAARNPENPPFSEADLELLVVLAHQAAAALENARLYAELRAYLRQVEESQQLLLQAEKMATAGRLTASIAHEINNPLQGVRNCLHLASRAELSEMERAEYLQLGREELDRLMTTVQRMLEFYRPSAVERSAVDLHALIERVVKLLHREMEQQNIRLHLSLSEDLPRPWAVRDQIQQVLLNLVLNAVEAMPEGGDLHIETRYNHDEVHITVADSGPGVPPHLRGQIFEPFFSTKDDGSGLGLTVCDGIITAHGGRLELLDSPDGGAHFLIALPLHSSEE